MLETTPMSPGNSDPSELLVAATESIGAPDGKHLVIAANRSHVVVYLDENNQLQWKEAGAGGLKTAMGPLVRGNVFDKVTWIGWAGTPHSAIEPEPGGLEEAMRSAGEASNMDLAAVLMSRRDLAGYYDGMSNRVLWFLFHGLSEYAELQDPSYNEWWRRYEKVNGMFADEIISKTDEDSIVFVQDYHLLLTGKEIRKQRPNQKMGFFLHIPFPSYEHFSQLPPEHALKIIEGLAEYDLVGFHTKSYMENFLSCVKRIFPDADIETRNNEISVKIGERRFRVGAFPISIDPQEFKDQASTDAVRQETAKVRADHPDQHLFVNVGRREPTKDPVRGVLGIEALLDNYAEYRGSIQHILVAPPSRSNIPAYKDLAKTLKDEVDRINKKFKDPRTGWVPIVYLPENKDTVRLLGLYGATDTGLILPIADGMNLVAKEMGVTAPDHAVLILSKTAGAAEQLQSALQVHPHDTLEVAATMQQALAMSSEERRARRDQWNRESHEYDIFTWGKEILGSLISG